MAAPSRAGGEAAAATVDVVEMKTAPIVPADVTGKRTDDIVVAGGIDGKVYALNAWTGDLMWVLDSGGPMIDSSLCGSGHASHVEHPAATDEVEIGEDGKIRSGDDRLVPAKRGSGADASSGAVVSPNAALTAQMMPMYDGRLVQVAKNSVRELEMTMADIINANGPVRLMDDATGRPSDVLLFGDKQTEVFSLDAKRGVIRPYLSSRSGDPNFRRFLFGRSTYRTRAVHSKNASATRCFSISEYFLHFADQPRCAADGDASSSAPPKLIVVNDDPYGDEPEQGGSTIAAFDAETREQLWEVHLPQFDILAVFGFSTNTGAKFFQWSIEGPSSSASHRRTDLVPANGKQEKVATAVNGVVEENFSGDQMAVARTVLSRKKSIDRGWKLRTLEGSNYIQADTSTVNLSEESAVSSSSTFDDPDDFDFDEPIVTGRRRFVTYMQSNGKRGVFITYYHVGAMVLGVMVGIVLIGWGCYVKGLSASLAQTAMKSIGSQPVSIQHILQIEQPGLQPITISSTISRQLLLKAAEATLGQRGIRFPLLENGEETDQASATSSEVPISPTSETALLQHISRLAAEEVSYMVTKGLRSHDAPQLECEPNSTNTTTASTASLSSLATSFSSGSVLPANELSGQCAQASDVSAASNQAELGEKRFFRVIEEFDESESSDMESEETKSAKDPLETERADGPEELMQPSSPSQCLSEDGECSVSSQDVSELKVAFASESSREEPSHQEASNESSSSSSGVTSEAEVLIPFVCQSRFANEFVELSPLGKGGFGQVILAENRLDGRKYAIKRVGLRLQNQTSKTLQKFLREVKILALLDHPNIVRYYQAWLEKIEASDEVASMASAETTRPRDFSKSNLLAPISEMEFSNLSKSKSRSFYSNGSLGEDDGFEWERNSDDDDLQDQGWTEDDIVTPKPRPQRQARPSVSTREDESSSNSPDLCDHWLYIQMQYCAGHNLGDYLMTPDRPPHLSKILKIFTQISSAIAHVHSCGLIHRDLKPANIFVADTDCDSIKLGDFGLSRYAANVNLASQGVDDQTMTISNVLRTTGEMLSTSMWNKSISSMSESNDVTAGVGTALYASPEQAAGKKYNAKTDIFSLGMILFELCHERFTTTMERYTTLANARNQLFPPSFAWESKCPDVMVMLRRLLSRDPMERPDAAEVVQWSQELYDVCQQQATAMSMSMLRSPLHLPSGLHGQIPPINIELVSTPVATSVFSLEVEARSDSQGTGDADSGEQRLPNHDLLKEVCDVIAQTNHGRTKIKKYGVRVQDDGGGQIFEFVLDSQPATDEQQEDGGALHPHERELELEQQAVVAAIQAMPSIQLVRLGAPPH